MQTNKLVADCNGDSIWTNRRIASAMPGRELQMSGRTGGRSLLRKAKLARSGLERISSKPLTATPKSSSENKNGALLRHKTGGDSTSVISRVGPYWSGRLELARSPDLFAQARPCQKSGETLLKRGNVASIRAMPFHRAKLDLPASWASEPCAPDLSNSGGIRADRYVCHKRKKNAHTHTHTQHRCIRASSSGIERF